MRAYVTATAENQKHVRVLRRKENMMADIIAAQSKRIANNDNVLKNLRTELQQYESGTKQAVFRDRRNRHRAACKKLKDDLLKGCAKDEQQLACLVRVTDDTIEWLEAAKKKGEKILRLAGLCRRYETQREKVLPFGGMIPHPPTEVEVNPRKGNTEDPLVINAIVSTSGLNRLWQRIAKAELSRRALVRERLLLEEENNVIMNNLEKYEETQSNLAATTECICSGKAVKKYSIAKPVAVEGVEALRYYKGYI